MKEIVWEILEIYKREKKSITNVVQVQKIAQQLH